MNYLNYCGTDLVNGNGIRTCIWLPYCTHSCKGCFNKGSWYGGGKPLTEEVESKLMQDLSKDFVKGATFSGGDPLDLHNLKWMYHICNRIKKELPEKDIMVYTGYTYEQLLKDERRKGILLLCDLLMDGKYECDNPTTKPFRGSANQVLHTLENSISIKQE